MAGEFDAALLRWREWMEPDPKRETGTILPLSNNREGTDLRLDVPTSVRETGQGFIDLLRGPSTGTVTPEASMSLLGMIAPNVATRPDLSELGVFVGPGARTFRGREAKALQAAGATEADTFRSTGVFRGPDGKQRMEIPDTETFVVEAPWEASQRVGAEAAAQGQTHPGYRTTLYDLFEHPEFYRAYPELQNAPVRLWAGVDQVPGESAQGLFYPRGAETWVGSEGGLGLAGTDPATARSTLLHELQHMIQRREGFSGGTSPDSARVHDYVSRQLTGAEPSSTVNQMRYNAYLAEGGEAEARAVQGRADLDAATLRGRHPRGSYDVDALWDARTGRPLPGWPR